MFAVIEIGGKQYQVREKDEFLVEKLGLEEGKFLKPKVLLLGSENEKEIKIGTPYLEEVSVEAQSLGLVKGEKIRVFKMKPDIRYSKTKGHRQKYTKLKILKIVVLNNKKSEIRKTAEKIEGQKKTRKTVKKVE